MKSILVLVVTFLLCSSAERGSGQWVGTGPYISVNVHTFLNSANSFYAGTVNGLQIYAGAWYSVLGFPDSLGAFAFAVLGSNIFVGTVHGVFLSTTNGISWKATGLTTVDVRALAVSGTSVFAGTYGGVGVLRSTDSGATWHPMNAGLTDTHVNTFAVSGTDIFSGTHAGVFLSTDSGASWEQLKNGLSDTGVFSLVILGKTLFAGTGSGGIFRSTNYGKNWVAVKQSSIVPALLISGSNIFATADFGILLSTDNGDTWTQQNKGLPSILGLALGVFDSSLFVGVSVSGIYDVSIWRRPLSEMIPVDAVKTPSIATSEFTLEQNVPNPFEATTTITFDIASRAFVTLKIIDAFGREVAVLASEELSPGKYSRLWDASRFAPGQYFYRLQAGEFAETKKLVVIR